MRRELLLPAALGLCFAIFFASMLYFRGRSDHRRHNARLRDFGRRESSYTAYILQLSIPSAVYTIMVIVYFLFALGIIYS